MKCRAGSPYFKHHATKTCVGIELRYSFRAGFQRFRINYQPHQTLGTRMMIRGTFHIEDPQALGAVIQNLVTRAFWCPGFVHRWLHTLSGSALDGCEWLASISGRVNPSKPPFMSHCLGSWWVPEEIADAAVKCCWP